MSNERSPRILAEIPDLGIAIHKPFGLRMHPANADGEDDLVAWLGRQPDLPPEMAPAHRLDLGASGIVLCSPSAEGRRELARWFAEGLVQKTYLAVVHGRTHKKGTIQRKLADGRRKKPLDAVTRYRRLEWLGGFTLVKAQPETGRKHQLRRHLHGIGHPIVGDDRYRPRHRRRIPGFPGRLWLHARVLELPTGQVIEDPLPPELLASLDAMRAGADRLAKRAATAAADRAAPIGEE